MNAITMLKDDHKKVKALFREFEGAGEKAFQTKQKLAREVFTELEVHTKLEEEIFYPAVRAKGNHELKEVVAEGLEEHHVVDVLIEELKGMEIAADPERYQAKFTVLTENVEHHIEEEEKEMLPDAQKRLGSEVDTLGDQMQQRKQVLMAQLSGVSSGRR